MVIINTVWLLSVQCGYQYSMDIISVQRGYYQCSMVALPTENFDRVKLLLTEDTVLVHYEHNRPLLLACDSSAYGIGAVLSHKIDDGSERPGAMIFDLVGDESRIALATLATKQVPAFAKRVKSARAALAKRAA